MTAISPPVLASDDVLEALGRIGRLGGRPSSAQSRQWVLPARGEGGFDIAVTIGECAVRVLFGELEQEFARLEEAMPWIERASTGAYRLRVDTIGGRACQWTLEPAEPRAGLFATLSAGHPVLLRSLRRQSSRFLRNLA